MRETHQELVARRTAELGVAEADLSHLHRVYFEGLGLCGCGNPEAWKLVHDLLRLFATKEFGYAGRIRELVGTDGACHIVLGVLDEADLTEHGGNIWSSWLTTKGEWVLAMLNKLDGVDIPGLFDELHIGLPHAGHECTDECWTVEQ